MTQAPEDDIVARQYKKWQYPEPIQDLETWAATNMDWFDPLHAHRVFWPDRPYQPDLDILVAGCGTNQAPTIAFNNRAARVVGIDISEESLDHARFLKDKHGLTNLELRRLPIEEAAALDRDFDLVIATGVLHHMASPEAGMKALAGVLRPDGVAAIMLYARYGRFGVEMMQSVFADMGFGQDDDSLRMVRAGLNFLAPNHPAKVYGAIATDLGYDAGLVDTFLHGRDRSFTVEGCLDLTNSAGLVFQDWFLKASLNPPVLVESDSEFLAAVSALPERQMWSVMERLGSLNSTHLFTVCRPERPVGSYRIDFTSPEAVGYVPLWRAYAGINRESITRVGLPGIQPSPDLRAHAELVDGERSIRQIAAAVARGAVDDDTGAPPRGTDLEQHALALFDQLWRMDFIAVDLSAVGRP